MPSRAYGVLSAARPLLVSADSDCETVRIVERSGCGIVVAPGRPELVAGAIRDAYEGRFDLDEMGRRGRTYVELEADRDVAIARYREVLAELVPSSSARESLSMSSTRRVTA